MSRKQTAGPMLGRLRIYPVNQPVLELWLTEPRIYSIGRGADSDLRLDDDGISRTHLLIDTRAEPWLAQDPGSKNGSRIEGRPLDRARLDERCWFSLAGIPGHFERLPNDELERTARIVQQHEHTASQLIDRMQDESDPEARLDQLLEGFLALSACSRGALILGGDSSPLRPLRLRGWKHFEGSRSVISRTLHQGQVTALNDLATAPELAGQESMIKRAIKAVVCLPLKLDGEVRGALYGESDLPGKVFTELDVALMQAMADQAMLLLGAESLRNAIQALSEKPDAGHLC